MNISSQDIKPKYDRCLVKPLFDDTIKGIIVPQKAKDNAKFVVARVISVGPGRVTESNGMVPLQVAVGDYILIEPKAGYPLSLADGTFLLISEMHVLTTVNYREPSPIVLVS